MRAPNPQVPYICLRIQDACHDQKLAGERAKSNQMCSQNIHIRYPNGVEVFLPTLASFKQQLAELNRLIFGAKSEWFIGNDINQPTL